MAKIDMTQKQSKTTTLNKNVALPKDRYTLRCMKEEFSFSKSSGEPMVTRVFEFVTESAELPDGTKLMLAGSELTKYYPLRSKGTAKSSVAQATARLLDQYKEDTDKMGVEIDWFNFDNEQPELKCQGVIVDAICGDEVRQERKAPRPGQKEGDPILGNDKKPILVHQAKLISIYGVSETKLNTGY